MAFPLDTTGGTPAPSYYATNTLTKRRNHFFVGDTVSWTISQASPTTYTVLDYYGNVVATGAISGTTVNLGSSWNPGWYRVRYSGGSTDVVYGTSYGANTFTVMRTNSHFRTATTEAGNGAPGQHSNPPDYASRGMMGIPADRMEMSAPVATDSVGNDSVTVLALDAPFATSWWSQLSTDAYVDSNRPRALEASVASRSWDKLDLANTGAGTWCTVYPKDGSKAAVANNLYVSAGAGTTGGTSKLIVYYPNSSTVVETWDNLATADSAAVTVNAGSAYVWLQTITSGSDAGTTAVTAIGNTNFLGLSYLSSTMYPLGVTYYEGPINEPGMNDAGLSQKLKLFKAGIQAGNADARILGPTPVDIVNNWQAFFVAGGHQYLDVLAFHDYNTFLGSDLALARYQIENMIALKNQYAPLLPMWQTEALSCAAVIGGGTSSIGLFIPRLSGNTALKLLVWEQHGLPKERNAYWYDFSHGFWGVANFQWCQDGSPLPVTILQRVMSEELFGKTFSYRLNMGCEALEKIGTGSVYKSHAGTMSPSVAVFCSGSHIPGATLSLNIVGTSANIDVVDAFGNVTSTAQSSNKITIPLDDVPTYVELPAGVTCSVHSFYDGAQDWGTSPNPSISRSATTHTLGGVSLPAIADDQFTTHYSGSNGNTSTGLAFSSITVPDTAILLFPSTVAVDRVIVFNGPVQQALSALLTFTVDTTTNGGSTWTTQTTVDVSSDAFSTQFGTTGATTGCGYETFWPQQRVFPVSFGSPVSCNGVRISVSATSYGGSPDEQSWHTSAAAVDEQRVSIEEIMVISADTPTSSVSAPVSSILPSITGGSGAGTVVACSSGTWTNVPTKYTYQWQKDGSNIGGATGGEYLVASGDIGHDISCIVTASNLGGSATANSGAFRVPTFRALS